MSEEGFIEVREPSAVYKIENLLYKDEVYKIIGCCFEVYNELGKGFSEAVYKKALEYEFTANTIPFEREKEYPVF